MTTADLGAVVAIIRQKQLELALQAFEAHAPWRVPQGLAFLSAATGSARVSCELLAAGCAMGLLEVREGDGTPVSPADLDENDPDSATDRWFHLGDGWQPTAAAFGMTINVVAQDRTSGDTDPSATTLS
jgi:hypothetical protein